MKKWIMTALGSLLLAAVFPTTAFAQELIVGGQAVGIRIRTVRGISSSIRRKRSYPIPPSLGMIL